MCAKMRLFFYMFLIIIILYFTTPVHVQYYMYNIFSKSNACNHVEYYKDA